MLRRAIDFLVMPLGFSIVLATIALLLLIFLRKRPRSLGRRIAFALGAASIVILYIASIRPTAEALTAWTERAHRVRAVEEIEPVDAVMVLGGAAEPALRRNGDPYLTTGPRFEAAMELVAAGRARILVLSGCGSQLVGDPLREGDHLRDEALRRGVEADRIVISPFVRTTGDEARVLAEMARERGWSRVAIATDAGHMWRAIPLARSYGLDAVPFTTHAEPPLPAQPALLHWLPTAVNLHRTTRAWHEILGRLIS